MEDQHGHLVDKSGRIVFDARCRVCLPDAVDNLDIKCCHTCGMPFVPDRLATNSQGVWDGKTFKPFCAHYSDDIRFTHL